MDTEKVEHKQKLLINVIIIAVSVITVVAVILTTMAAVNVKSVYHDLILEELKATTEHLADEAAALNDSTTGSSFTSGKSPKSGKSGAGASAEVSAGALCSGTVS